MAVAPPMLVGAAAGAAFGRKAPRVTVQMVTSALIVFDRDFRDGGDPGGSGDDRVAGRGSRVVGRGCRGLRIDGRGTRRQVLSAEC